MIPWIVLPKDSEDNGTVCFFFSSLWMQFVIGNIKMSASIHTKYPQDVHRWSIHLFYSFFRPFLEFMQAFKCLTQKGFKFSSRVTVIPLKSWKLFDKLIALFESMSPSWSSLSTICLCPSIELLNVSVSPLRKFFFVCYIKISVSLC